MLNELVVDVETTGLDPFNDELLGYGIFEKGKSCYISEPDCINNLGNLQNFNIAHNGKFDAKFLVTRLNTKITIAFDTQIAYYLLHIDRPKKLESIVKDLFNKDKEDLLSVYNRITEEKRQNLPNDWHTKVSKEELAKYCQEDVTYAYKIYGYCREKLSMYPHLEEWFYRVEMPLVNILVQAELKGVKLNQKKLKQLEIIVTHKLGELNYILTKLANDNSINFNSSKQLQELLYKKFKLPKLKRTKTGWSTDMKVLEKLAVNDGFCRTLVEHRELTKLQSAFIKPLQEYAKNDGRLHASFNQTGTKTRRFSCSNPNLQQIPIRSNLGKEIRECFVSSPGCKFLIVDYSQIELRLLAHFSKEPRLIGAFKNGQDVHQRTADYISQKLGTEFTRDQGKILNFSIIYGKTAYGFARDWNCSNTVAQKILDAYFNYYPRVKEWIYEQQIECQVNNGWIKTLGELPLYIPNINSNNEYEFEGAKRQAVNYKIQGSSQDILKKAIVGVYTAFGNYPILFVHDELVYDMPLTSCNPEGIIKVIKGVWKLDVPIEVNYKISDRWEKDR